MSIQATVWAVKLRGIPPLAKLVAIALSENHSGDDDHVNADIIYLCNFCNGTVPAIFRALDEIPGITWRRGVGDRIEAELHGIGRD